MSGIKLDVQIGPPRVRRARVRKPTVRIAKIDRKTQIKVSGYPVESIGGVKKFAPYMKIPYRDSDSLGVYPQDVESCNAVIATMQKIKRQLIREGKQNVKNGKSTKLKSNQTTRK